MPTALDSHYIAPSQRSSPPIRPQSPTASSRAPPKLWASLFLTLDHFFKTLPLFFELGSLFLTLDHFFWTLTYSFLTLACSFLTLAYFPILVWNLAPSCTFSHFTVNPRWSSAPVLLPPAELPPQASSKLFPNYVHAFHSVRARAFLPSFPSFLPSFPSFLPLFLPAFLPSCLRPALLSPSSRGKGS